MTINWTCISVNYLENSANFTQGAHIHQPTAGPVPHACAQPYHVGSSSHRQLFRSYWAWRPCKAVWLTNERFSKTLYCRGECKAVYQAPATHNTFGSCWLGTAQQFYHDMRRGGGSRVTSKLKQKWAHIHQHPAWQLPHACAQPHYAGSGSHGQLFRPYEAHQCHSLLSVIIDSRFFLPLEQLRTALLSYHLAASRVFLGVFSFDLPIRPRAPQNNPQSSLTPKTHKNWKFYRGARPRSPLEAHAFDARLGKQSVSSPVLWQVW